MFEMFYILYIPLKSPSITCQLSSSKVKLLPFKFHVPKQLLVLFDQAMLFVRLVLMGTASIFLLKPTELDPNAPRESTVGPLVFDI